LENNPEDKVDDGYVDINTSTARIEETKSNYVKNINFDQRKHPSTKSISKNGENN
jgi:hypothetical protein